MIMRHKRIFTVLVVSIIFSLIIAMAAFVRVNNERKEALRQQSQAERNLELYKKAQRQNDEMQKDMSVLFNEIIRGENTDNAQRKIQLLAKHITQEKMPYKLRKLFKEKGLLHLIEQEYTKAAECFQHIGGHSKFLDLARYANSFTRSLRKLRDREFVMVANRLSASNKGLIEAMYAKHMHFRSKKENTHDDYAFLARMMLNVCNNVWGLERIKKPLTISDGVIDLSHSHYRTLRIAGGYGMNVLEPFNDIQGVDLSYSGFFEFAQLADLTISELNIAGCKVNELTVGRCKQIKQLGITKIVVSDDYSSQEIANVKRYFDTRIVTSK